MNCPNCGKKKEITTTDVLIGLLVECGAKTNHSLEFCQCSQGIKAPKFIVGNWLTQTRAEVKGDMWVAIWKTHNLPEMRDCRDLKYKYAVVGDRIICNAMNDYYDITSEVLPKEDHNR